MISWSDMLRTMPLVAILRGVTPEEVVAIGRALHEGGIVCVEVPLNSPRPLDSIAALRSALSDDMLIGAGTVLSVDDVESAAAAGAQFVVSPNTDAAVIAATKAKGLRSLPGFYTATEAFAAIAAGADALKLFPADTAPPAYLKALKAVLPPAIPVLAVGGANAGNLSTYAAAGAAGFGLGSSLYKPGDAPDAVRTRAADLVRAFQAARSY